MSEKSGFGFWLSHPCPPLSSQQNSTSFLNILHWWRSCLIYCKKILQLNQICFVKLMKGWPDCLVKVIQRDMLVLLTLLTIKDISFQQLCLWTSPYQHSIPQTWLASKAKPNQAKGCFSSVLVSLQHFLWAAGCAKGAGLQRLSPWSLLCQYYHIDSLLSSQFK